MHFDKSVLIFDFLIEPSAYFTRFNKSLPVFTFHKSLPIFSQASGYVLLFHKPLAIFPFDASFRTFFAF
jgi:hypothetical protein